MFVCVCDIMLSNGRLFYNQLELLFYATCGTSKIRTMAIVVVVCDHVYLKLTVTKLFVSFSDIKYKP